MKLNLGSGSVLLEGWINIDILPVADFQHDLTKPLPYANNSVGFIYSEHFIEHIEYHQAQSLLKECFRVLKKGGVLRIATPDLDYVMEKYQGNWEKQEWLKHDDYRFIKSRGRMINYAFRAWGHKHLWNEEDLMDSFFESGFAMPYREELNHSLYNELCNLETRADSKLIMECVK